MPVRLLLMPLCAGALFLIRSVGGVPPPTAHIRENDNDALPGVASSSSASGSYLRVNHVGNEDPKPPQPWDDGAEDVIAETGPHVPAVAGGPAASLPVLRTSARAPRSLHEVMRQRSHKTKTSKTPKTSKTSKSEGRHGDDRGDRDGDDGFNDDPSLNPFHVHMEEIRRERRRRSPKLSEEEKREQLRKGLEEEEERLITLESQIKSVLNPTVLHTTTTTAPGSCGTECQTWLSNLLDVVKDALDIYDDLKELWNCVFGADCEKTWIEPALKLALKAATIISWFSKAVALAWGFTAALLGIFNRIWLLFWNSGEENPAQMSNTRIYEAIIDRVQDNKLIGKSILRDLRLELLSETNNRWEKDLLTFIKWLDSNADIQTTHGYVESFLLNVTSKNMGGVFDDSLKMTEKQYNAFAQDTRHTVFLDKDIWKDSCSSGRCGYGAVNNFVKGASGQKIVEECQTDHQETVESLPIFFNQLQELRAMVYTYKGRILSLAQDAVNKIKNNTAYSSDSRVERLEEIVSCNINNMGNVVRLLENVGSIYTVACKPLKETLKGMNHTFPDVDKTNLYDYGLEADFDVWSQLSGQRRRNSIGSHKFRESVGALGQTCAKAKRCSFPYLLYRCNDERILSDEEGKPPIGAVQWSGPGRNLNKIDAECKNWREEAWAGPSWYMFERLYIFAAGSGDHPPSHIDLISSTPCSLAYYDLCPRNSIKWAKENIYAYTLPEYCLKAWSTRENVCQAEMSKNSRWKVPDRRNCRVN